ncbi:Cholesterol 7-alpha-monooxygenase [Paramyrothecium foliicola]|nr:Cholesterol 7-alpha-monooxygenase [Paramyrothecium foliicola]
MGAQDSITKSSLLEFLWIPAIPYFSMDKTTSVLPILGVLLLVHALISYVFIASRWHFVNRFEKLKGNEGRAPPKFPSVVPYVGNALAFAWDNANFLRRATSYANRLTASRISFLGFEIYCFQDRQTIANIWKQSTTLSSPSTIYVYVFKYFFGISEYCLSVYRADNSGPFHKPWAGSNVPADGRVDHVTHHGFLQALNGPDLLSTTKRYMKSLTARLEEKNFSEEWTDVADFSSFFRDVVGSALIESLFGPTMLRINPQFIEDLWGFDDSIPWLARGVPAFLRPSAHEHRERGVTQLKRWYAYAREHFDESNISRDGDGDPIWGSKLMRYRQEKVLALRAHDDEALARMDLGLAWGAVGNTIPCAMLSAFHVFKDGELLERVRGDVERFLGQSHLLDVDPNKLIKESLLSSIYAETLRLYVKTYFMVSSPHSDVHLGKWLLPKGRIGLMNAGISHLDASFWNDYGGEHPVTSFWADRFIVDPKDGQSGPVAPHVRESTDYTSPKVDDNDKPRNSPYFSMDGTEGSWYPYGGNHGICPGRFLAKSVILFTCAHLSKNYDIEILPDNVKISPWRPPSTSVSDMEPRQQPTSLPPGMTLCMLPAGSSPDGSLSDFVNVETLVPVLISVCVLLTFFAIIFTVCRLFANRRKLWWSDYLVALGLVLSLGHTGLMLAQTRYARHQWDVRACWYDGKYTKLLFAQQIILNFSLFFSKASIFLLFQQIFEVQKFMRMSVIGGIIFTGLLYFTSIPTSALLSAPRIGETWASVLTSGRPEKALLWGVVQAALAILLDLFIFALPIPSILRLNLSTKRKVQLLCVFITALVGVVASVLSLVYRVEAIDTTDGTWKYTSLVICNVVENDVAIIVSSTPGFANFARLYLSELGIVRTLSSTFGGSGSRTRINKRSMDNADPNRPRTKKDSRNKSDHEFDTLSDTIALKSSASHDDYDGIVRTVDFSQESHHPSSLTKTTSRDPEAQNYPKQTYTYQPDANQPPAHPARFHKTYASGKHQS